MILCIVMFFLGHGLSIRRAAMNRLNAEIKDKQEEYNSLSEQKTQLETEISTLTDEANSNSEINVKIKSDEEKLAELNSQLDTAKKTNEALTKQLEEKKNAQQEQPKRRETATLIPLAAVSAERKQNLPQTPIRVLTT